MVTKPTETKQKPAPVVTFRMVPGIVTPQQRAAKERFWKGVISGELVEKEGK